MPIEMQSAIVAEVIARLAVVELFGVRVFEDSVMRVLDAADETLPDYFIVIQPGSTEEVERQAQLSVRERMTLNITVVTKVRGFAPLLRAARWGIKSALPGVKGGISVQGVQTVSFQPETPLPPAEGHRWSAHVMPIQITYIQPLK